ncbi:Protein of uncharacterised function (DUF3131) [Yersinia aldovae]|uniref:DUF3131 domain-containing protein n=1 Tax=Yersinia aldovae TaxID=29483 RepID=UPI0005E69001|nr:DUF3131 domain-containing protein [Yersinia aldovae]CNH42979.1 Protein of uncharacterised function (DUF3131) [Yersinia aldovae]
MRKTVRCSALALVIAAGLFSAAFIGGMSVGANIDQSSVTYSARSGVLSDNEQLWAKVAWRYFINNAQSGTGLINSLDNYPVVNLWQIGDTLVSLTAAAQLGIINRQEFDQRLSLLLATISHLPLVAGKAPNLLYNTVNGQMIDYANQPKPLGWSAQDIGRLMMGLKVVVRFYPEYAEYLDKLLLRWNFCQVIDNDGRLLKSTAVNGQFIARSEGRLGYSNYVAGAFGLWGFPVGISANLPYNTIFIYGIPIDVDIRDARTTSVPSIVVSLPYLLTAMELKSTPIFKQQKNRIDNVYRVQEKRWHKEHILTARSDYFISVAPYHVYDTVFANGYHWNTISEDGKFHPDLALVSTRAVFGLWVLWNSPYTDALMQLTQMQYDEQRGWYEGRYENNGAYNKTISLTTNAMVLETLLYKTAGNLINTEPAAGYLDVRMSDVFSRPQLCLPQERVIALGAAK